MPSVSRSQPCLIDVRSASTIRPVRFAACILAHLMKQDNQTPLDAVLDFWFGPQPARVQRRRPRAGVGSPPIRNSIARYRGTFGRVAGSSRGGRTDGVARRSARPSRVHHRHRPVLPTDPQRLRRGVRDRRVGACRQRANGVELGHDRQLGYDERAFFYLPFEHSESKEDQHTSVELFTRARRRHAGRQPRPLATRRLRFAHRTSRHRAAVRPLPASQRASRPHFDAGRTRVPAYREPVRPVTTVARLRLVDAVALHEAPVLQIERVLERLHLFRVQHLAHLFQRVFGDRPQQARHALVDFFGRRYGLRV